VILLFVSCGRGSLSALSTYVGKMVFIKICGITNLPDALAAIEAGADALGFNFYRRSPRYIPPGDVRKIIEQLPTNILNIGVFVNEPSLGAVAEIAGAAGVRGVQLHGDETPDFCHAIKDLYVIKALRVDSRFSESTALAYKTDAVLLDAYSPTLLGGTGEVFDWSRARERNSLWPKLFLAGGLSPENVREAIETVKPYGVDACSCLEISPGVKDQNRVRAFVAAARSGGTP
jgi:phosphoribosylanthranilate isomerase